MPSGFPEALTLCWPGQTLDTSRANPGDLARFVPQGFGPVPQVATPFAAAAPPDAYGFQPARGHPFFDAPRSEPSGGSLYFDEAARIADLAGALSLMGVYNTVDYMALAASSADPAEDGYLDQMRLVSFLAATSVFGVAAGDLPAPQPLPVIEAVIAFVAAQREKWNAPQSGLAGSAGGDGDWAKEALAFGFHTENSYWGIYRVWSRAWLVTK